MRLTEGRFNSAEGIETWAPEALFEYGWHDETVRLVCLHRSGLQSEKIMGRVLIIDVWCPLEGSFALRVSHHYRGRTGRSNLSRNKFSGRPGDDADGRPLGTDGRLILTDARARFGLNETETALEIRSGDAMLRVEREPLTFTLFRQDEIITRIGAGGLLRVSKEGEVYLACELDLGIDECIYGLGERFGPLQRRGQSVVLRNGDYATTSDRGYKNVPFYLSSSGYGLLVNDPAAVEFEIATDMVEKLQFSLPGDAMEVVLFPGDTPAEVLGRYTELAGKPAMPPQWSFGLWLTTSFTTTYNREIVLEQLHAMRNKEIDLSVFHFDCFWMTERHWIDFEWDRVAFPEPETLIEELHEQGLRVCLWINPYLSELSGAFEEAAESGYLVRRDDGSPYQIDWWQPGIGFVDFSNPLACDWYKDKLRRLLRMGIDCFKSDFGESAPEDGIYFGESDSLRMRNRYALLYNRTVFELLQEERGEGEAVLFARSATAGSQRYPVHWGGDCEASYSSMASQLRGGLSLGLSGFGFWSHDIGGFFGTPTPDLYKRWIAFGLLSSHSRLHGNESYRVPWLFDEEAVEVLRHFVNLRKRLMPYIVAQARESTDRGIPLMRAMLLEFPTDPTCRHIETQYMLGSGLLVAPVFRQDGSAKVYLPPGRWTDYWSREKLRGPGWHTRDCSYFEIPLYLREGTELPRHE